MEKAQKKAEYQAYIDHIIDTHNLAGSSSYNKEREFVCHLDVDKILCVVKDEYKNRQNLVKQGIKHNVVSPHRDVYQNHTVHIPQRESLINHSHRNEGLTRGFLSMFA